MKARRLIETSTFEPETLQVLYKAFDDAWAEISQHFDGYSEDARTRLAHAILLVAREDSKDADRLKDTALQVMALGSRQRD